MITISYLKKYSKTIFLNILEILIFLFILTILYYYNIINNKTYQILKLITLLLSIFINSYLLKTKSKTKSYIDGIKYGIIFIILIFIPTIILSKISNKLLIYYPLILSTSTLASMMKYKKNKQ